MWKLLFAVDGLVFAESSASVEGSRRQALSERIAWIDEGQWGLCGPRQMHMALGSATRVTRMSPLQRGWKSSSRP
eukprot:5178793-Lingulodinium_polyedra.AAC.1